MTVFVDALTRYGWVLRGRRVASCHLFTDQVDLAELHRLAARCGLRRRWFQDHPLAPHYDLTPGRRSVAIALGAVVVTRHEAVLVWRRRRALVALPAIQAAGGMVAPNETGHAR